MSETPVKQPNSIPAAIAAIRTLEAHGFTYTEGAQLWRPALGKARISINSAAAGLQSRMANDVLNGVYWVYQGDGHDHVESLTCPVVIDPRLLHSMLKNISKFHTALQCVGSALGLLAGSDVTTAAVPAIEALVRARSIPAKVPEDWHMRITGDAAVVQKEGLGGVVAHADVGSIAESILYALVTDILATPAANSSANKQPDRVNGW